MLRLGRKKLNLKTILSKFLCFFLCCNIHNSHATCIHYSIKLEDLDIIRVIETGAFSTVKLVKLKDKNYFDLKQQNDIPQVFALKCLIPITNDNKTMDYSDNSNNNNRLIELFTREKEIMHELNGSSPFITRFYCEFHTNSIESFGATNIFFLLEALLGGDLLNLLQNKSKFTEDWSMFYSASVISAFSEIHSRLVNISCIF